MMTRDKARAVLALGMALILIASTVPAAAIAQEDGQESDGATTIDSCTTITEPGEYELADDLTNATANTTIFEFDGVQVDACVVVASDDVVLTGNGNAVEGVAEPTNGTNVSIANQTTDANLTNVTNATGDLNETADGNETLTLDVGVAVLPLNDTEANLTNVTVRDVDSANWFAGVFADNVTESTLQGIEASDNVEIGFELDNVTNSSIGDVRATDNGGIGGIVYRSDDNALSDLHAENNTYVGYVVGESHRNQLRNVTALNQNIAGMAVFSSDENAMIGVDVRNTSGDAPTFGPSAGLLLDNASDNFVTDVTASDNRNWTYYSWNGSTGNFVLNLTDDGTQLSFAATDVALRFDENATDEPGLPLVVLDTGENASVLVDVNWAATDAPTDVPNETTDAGDDLTDDGPTNATADENATAANETNAAAGEF